MKKRSVLFTFVIGFGYLALTSSQFGGAYIYGVDGSEAAGSPTGTCARSGCHFQSATTTVAMELDSAGVSVNHYIAGHSYVIKITGKNTSPTMTLPGFGFQVAVVKSIGAATTSAQNAGAFNSSTLPPYTQLTTPAESALPIDVVEQNTPITATTGNGGNGSTYVEFIAWTAPATPGTGYIKIYGCVNAVNEDGTCNGDAYNAATPITIAELKPSASIASFSESNDIKAYPNPFSNQFRLQFNNADPGTYTLKAYDLNGKCLFDQNVILSSNSFETFINTTNWAPGYYGIQIIKDGSQRIIPLLKQ